MQSVKAGLYSKLNFQSGFSGSVSWGGAVAALGWLGGPGAVGGVGRYGWPAEGVLDFGWPKATQIALKFLGFLLLGQSNFCESFPFCKYFFRRL